MNRLLHPFSKLLKMAAFSLMGVFSLSSCWSDDAFIPDRLELGMPSVTSTGQNQAGARLNDGSPIISITRDRDWATGQENYIFHHDYLLPDSVSRISAMELIFYHPREIHLEDPEAFHFLIPLSQQPFEAMEEMLPLKGQSFDLAEQPLYFLRDDQWIPSTFGNLSIRHLSIEDDFSFLISGTFGFELLDNQWQVRTLTEGRFDFIFNFFPVELHEFDVWIE
ncbi:MAG: hypothetical protein LAT68_10550 [Cyclobacteriaceae bacterium]|nr:hypothetical protein [Cyclobacteriaceae bacterium]MCH8516755.1 hypothetical protein [Cyclobacteriaceae bacterium]